MLLLTIIIFSVLLLSYYVSGRDFLAPSVLFGVGFLACAVMAIAFQDYWGFVLHPDTIIIISSGVISFSIASYILRDAIARKDGTQVFVPISIRQSMILIFAALQALVIVWTILEISKMFPSNGIADSIKLYNQKSTFSADRPTFPTILTHSRYFCVAGSYVVAYLFAQELALKSRGGIVALSVSLVLGVALNLETGSRTVAVGLFVITALMYLVIKRRNDVGRRAFDVKRAFAVIAFCCVILVAFRFAAIGRDLSSFGFSEYLAIYVGAEIPNFDLFVRDPQRSDGGIVGYMTFIRTINYIGVKLGIPEFIYALDLPFREMNGHSLGNVYTTFYAFYYDFGYVGVVLLSGVMAAISQFIYAKAMGRLSSKHAEMWIIVYAYIAFQLLLCFFSNKFYESVLSVDFFRMLVYMIVFRGLYLYAPALGAGGILRLSPSGNSACWPFGKKRKSSLD